jgi:hypothetical protein
MKQGGRSIWSGFVVSSSFKERTTEDGVVVKNLRIRAPYFFGYAVT